MYKECRCSVVQVRCFAGDSTMLQAQHVPAVNSVSRMKDASGNNNHSVLASATGTIAQPKHETEHPAAADRDAENDGGDCSFEFDVDMCFDDAFGGCDGIYGAPYGGDDCNGHNIPQDIGNVDFPMGQSSSPRDGDLAAHTAPSSIDGVLTASKHLEYASAGCKHTEEQLQGAHAALAQPAAFHNVEHVVPMHSHRLAVGATELSQQLPDPVNVCVMLLVKDIDNNDSQSVAVAVTIQAQSHVVCAEPFRASMAGIELPAVCGQKGGPTVHAANPEALVEKYHDFQQPEQSQELAQASEVQSQRMGKKRERGIAPVNISGAGGSDGAMRVQSTMQQMAAPASSQNQISWGKPFHVKVRSSPFHQQEISRYACASSQRQHAASHAVRSVCSPLTPPVTIEVHQLCFNHIGKSSNAILMVVLHEFWQTFR